MKRYILILLFVFSFDAFGGDITEDIWHISRIQITSTMNALNAMDARLMPGTIGLSSYDFINDQYFFFTIFPSYKKDNTDLVIKKDTLERPLAYMLYFAKDNMYIWSEKSRQYCYLTYAVYKDSLRIDDWWGKLKYAGKLLLLEDGLVYTIESKSEWEYNRYIYFFEKVKSSISDEIGKNYFKKRGYMLFRNFGL